MPSIECKLDITCKIISCMLDTGSNKSLIRKSCLNNNAFFNDQVKFAMIGANNHSFSTLGSVFTLAYYKRKIFPILLHVVEENVFPMTWDVVIGIDFLKNCVIDMQNHKLTIYKNHDVAFMMSSNFQEERLKVLLNTLKTDHLSQLNAEKLRKLCSKYSDIFFVEGFDKLKATNVLEHDIGLTTDKPIFTKQYPVPLHFKPIMKDIALDLLNQGVIKHTMSPFNSPAILVKRKSTDGKDRYRLCIDFRKINEVLKASFYSLPKLNDLFEKFEKSRIFSSLDLADSFLQIPIKLEDQEKLAFSIPECGRFCYTRVPYGLQSSSFIFQKMIDQAMSSMGSESFLSYIDDCVVHSVNILENFLFFILVFFFSLSKPFMALK